MIHVAPCSCELHVEIRRLQTWNQEQATRIRELEAELADFKRWLHESSDMVERNHARAEKAEAAAHTEATAAQIHFEARQRLEARVAELERKNAASS